MPSHPAVEAIRTVALVGDSAAGKTSLVEAMLYHAGVIGAPASVERGGTVSDFDPLEKKFQHSLNSSLVHFEREGARVHVIDTPGAPDFIGPALGALEAVESAAVVVSAQSGAGATTSRLMGIAAKRGLCRMIIVNKIDAQGVDLPGVLARLQAVFGKECLPLNLPAEGAARVVDCFYNASGEADFSSVDAAHRALVEQVVEVDPDFVERYLSEGDVDPRELHAPLEQALREGHLIPVCFVSARTGAGVRELLDAIARLLPNPTEGNPPQFLRGEGEAAEALRCDPDPSKHVIAHVFKVSVDPYVGKLGIFRVHQGTVTRDSQLYIGDARKTFKVGHLLMLRGKEHVEVPSAVPGDLCAVAKIDDMHYDAVLHDAPEDDRIHLQPLALPNPVHGLAIEPKRRGDEQRMWEILQKLVDEDPCLKVEHVATTNETVVYGLGELHLRTLLERLTDIYRCEVATRPPRIAYRETISRPAEGHYRHKKQSGGAGQFGEVFLRVEPLARGAGFEFLDEVKGGTIPGQFIPAVEKGVRQVLASGVVSGHPLQDLRVTVYDGKHHPVDSKEVAFVIAGRKALVDAVQKAQPAVLEPIVQVEISAPEPSIGDITGDLSSRRGQVNGTEVLAGGEAVVSGLVPLAELSAYQARLNGLTGGHGHYTIALSHYEPVPPAVQQQLIAQYRPSEEE